MGQEGKRRMRDFSKIKSKRPRRAIGKERNNRKALKISGCSDRKKVEGLRRMRKECRYDKLEKEKKPARRKGGVRSTKK